MALNRRRVALITGASAGIGAAFARAYARRNCDVVLTARRLDRLDALAAELRSGCSSRVVCIAADLAKSGAADAMLTELQRQGLEIDILVNNAGYGLPGTWRDTGWQAQADALQVMLTAPLELSHKLLPGMASRNWGRILNIASLAGFAPGARGHTTYGAIKSALIKFSQSLNVEMEHTGVHVTAVCPGFTRTEFHDVNGQRARVNRLPNYLWQSAEDVAETGANACDANHAVVVTGVANKLIAGVAKVTPDPLALMLVKSRYLRKTP